VLYFIDTRETAYCIGRLGSNSTTCERVIYIYAEIILYNQLFEFLHDKMYSLIYIVSKRSSTEDTPLYAGFSEGARIITHLNTTTTKKDRWVVFKR